jgi:uncharacterized protein YcgI (DUF1989 family)
LLPPPCSATGTGCPRRLREEGCRQQTLRQAGADPVGANGAHSIEPQLSRAGDVVTFPATMNALCALSACPMDLNACNGGTITGLRVRVHNEADWL